MNTFQRSLLSVTLLLTSISFMHSVIGSNCANPSATENILFVDSDFAPGTVLGYTPMEFQVPPVAPATKATAVQGFDAQLATQLAHRLGFSDGAAFNQTSFVTLLDTLANEGTALNIGISAISITQERKRVFANKLAFIKYNDDALAIFVPTRLVTAHPELKDGKTVLATLNTLSATDKTIAITTLTGAREFFIVNTASVYPNFTLTTHDNLTMAIAQVEDELSLGQNFSFFTDQPTALALVEANKLPEFTLITDVQFDTVKIEDQVSDGLGIAIPAGCCQLYADIAQAIKDMEADGTLALMRKTWGTGTFTPVDLTPDTCKDTVPDINSNVIDSFIFTKYCSQTAAIIS